MIISLDGWSSSNNFKIDYTSRDIFPVGWCKSAGIRIAKLGGHRTSSKTLPTDEKNGHSEQSIDSPSIKTECIEFEEVQTQNLKKDNPIGKIFLIKTSSFH